LEPTHADACIQKVKVRSRFIVTQRVGQPVRKKLFDLIVLF
jgi:hypothetical protein